MKISVEDIIKVFESIKLLQAQRDELLEALKKYGEHKAGCTEQKLAAMDSGSYPVCTCGLLQAIASADKE